MAFASFLFFFCGVVAALAQAGPVAAGDGRGSAALNVTVDSLADVFFDGVFYPGEGFYLRDSPSVHDPSRLVRVAAANGTELLMLAATGKEQADGYGCGLETWYLLPDGLVPGQCILQEKPEWALDLVPSNPGAYWAPGFAGADGTRLYYTVNTLVDDDDADVEDLRTCIGMATATGLAPDLLWQDAGKPVLCMQRGEYNLEALEPPALDPAVFVDDDGSQWLVFGGAHIWLTELDPETGFLADDPPSPASWEDEGGPAPSTGWWHLANGPFGSDPEADDNWAEAAYMHKHDGYFYLFVNYFARCNGPDSTYEIRVGRSRNITGPYVCPAGKSMLEGNGMTLMASWTHGDIGPGHAGVFSFNGTHRPVDVLTYHYYPEDEEPWAFVKARTLTWDDERGGWPSVGQDLWDPQEFYAGT